MKKLYTLLLTLLAFGSVFAQQAAPPVEMADAMRGSGKIYVVIAIIAVIFTGLAIYLFSIDRRLKKLEK